MLEGLILGACLNEYAKHKNEKREKKHLLESVQSYIELLSAKCDSYLESKGLAYYKKNEFHCDSAFIAPIYDVEFNGGYHVCISLNHGCIAGNISDIHELGKKYNDIFDKIEASYEQFKQTIEDCINKYGNYKGEYKNETTN